MNMSAKQYERQLDEEIEISGKMFTVARFPNGWNVYLSSGEETVVKGEADKKSAIAKAERINESRHRHVRFL